MRPETLDRAKPWVPLVALVFIVIAGAAHVAWGAEKPFHISLEDVEKAVARELEAAGAGGQVQATVISKQNRTLYSSPEPLNFSVTSLDFNARSMQWNAELQVYAAGELDKTISVTGRYEAMVEIPVLSRRLTGDDVIEEADVEWITYPDHRLRKDTAFKLSELLGKAPRRVISENRPIRLSELADPIVMKRGSLVTLFFESGAMQIRTVGEALDDGAMGDTVRIRNADSDIVIQASVTGASSAQVNRPVQLPEKLASAH